MSRVGKNPIQIPKSTEITIVDQMVTVKGSKGEVKHQIPSYLDIVQEDGHLQISVNQDVVKRERINSKNVDAMFGTTRALLQNKVTGVSVGFVKKLTLVGVGYRAVAKGKSLNLTLGLSHPVEYISPEGITIETPSATEIIVSGIDKQLVGQTASEIRKYRPPEPYKGKGIRYSDEVIIKKETKKK